MIWWNVCLDRGLGLNLDHRSNIIYFFSIIYFSFNKYKKKTLDEFVDAIQELRPRYEYYKILNSNYGFRTWNNFRCISFLNCKCIRNPGNLL